MRVCLTMYVFIVYSNGQVIHDNELGKARIRFVKIGQVYSVFKHKLTVDIFEPCSMIKINTLMRYENMKLSLDIFRTFDITLRRLYIFW